MITAPLVSVSRRVGVDKEAVLPGAYQTQDRELKTKLTPLLVDAHKILHSRSVRSLRLCLVEITRRRGFLENQKKKKNLEHYR